METIKNLFNRVTDFLAKQFAKAAEFIVKLALPAAKAGIWSTKNTLKFVAAVVIAICGLMALNAGLCLLVTAITFVLAFVLPLVVANMIALVIVALPVLVAINRIDEHLPQEITVSL